MKVIKKNKKVPIEILAARKANRELEQLLFGEGFHSCTRIKRNKKTYCRKRKHANRTEE